MNILFYLLFNFIIYSFMGWVIEELYSFFITGKFKKDGFLKGPFKPMYGIAFTYLILCNEILDINGMSLILLCFLIPTTVEYISGSILKYIFNKVYWDYSNFKYNMHGFVTLKFSLYWTFLSYIGIYFFQPAIHNFYEQSKLNLTIGVCFFSIMLITDLILTLQNFKESKFLGKRHVK